MLALHAGLPIVPATRVWWLCFAGALVLLALWLVSVAVLFGHGVVVWGNTIPVNWGMAIINYVWFLGIGHAGTLISALLLITNRNWRNSLNRFAEAMTLCAVVRSEARRVGKECVSTCRSRWSPYT